MSDIHYRPVHPAEEPQVCAMITACFNEFVAPGYSQEGNAEFLKYVVPEALSQRLRENRRFMLLALDGASPVGCIEMRPGHISLLFVQKEYQHRGIAGSLLKMAVERSSRENPGLALIDVNSSPYAVPIYARLGFVQTGSEQTQNGIRYTPMALKVT